MRPTSENGHKIVSHREQSCSVQKISWCRIGCGDGLCLVFTMCFFFCWWESHGKSPVAVALSLQLKILCTYPVLWQLYICESEERKYPSKIYIFCSLILFSLIVAWKIKVFGSIKVIFQIIFIKRTHTTKTFLTVILSHLIRSLHTAVFVMFASSTTRGRWSMAVS